MIVGINNISRLKKEEGLYNPYWTVFEFTTTMPNETVDFRVHQLGIRTRNIDYGDGTSGTSGTHTYADAGTYTVILKPYFGQKNAFKFENLGGKNNITKGIQWGSYLVVDEAFRGCINLDLTEIEGEFDFSDYCRGSFYNIKDIGNAELWDWDAITNGQGMLWNVDSSQPFLVESMKNLELATPWYGSWNAGMFAGWINYNFDFPLYNLESLVNANFMFNDFRSYPGDFIFKTSSALTDINSMFYNCLNVNAICLSECVSVTGIIERGQHAFQNNLKLKHLFLPNIGVSFNISWSTLMTKQAILDLCNGGTYNGTSYNGVADRTGQTAPTVTLPTHLAGDQDIEDAFTDKNWVVAY